MATFLGGGGGGKTVGTPSVLQGVLGATSAAYGELIQRGRENEAYALRDAERRFINSVTGTGINSFARGRALADLKAQMGAARMQLEGSQTAQMLQLQAGMAGQIDSLDQRDKEFLANQEAMEKTRLQQNSQYDSTLAEQKRQFDANLALQQERTRPQMNFLPPKAPTHLPRPSISSGGNQNQAQTGMSPEMRDARERILRNEQNRLQATAGGFLAKPFMNQFQNSARDLTYVRSF